MELPCSFDDVAERCYPARLMIVFSHVCRPLSVKMSHQYKPMSPQNGTEAAIFSTQM